ncbi:MAG TPA: potassium-transporting ATPase subunit C [Thermoplasmata archaeon]|nr:potassium-transporting ATPase subunit C [Thermoplasmata archaeon]
MQLDTVLRDHLRPSLLLLGLFALLFMGAYPAVLAGIDGVANPNAAQGSPLVCKGQVVGSTLIAQNISSPMFFHPRNASASDSGVDPDLTPAQAYAQVASVSNATGILESSLDYLVAQQVTDNQNLNFFFAPPYVNVNTLNLDLIQLYPNTYAAFCPA